MEENNVYAGRPAQNVTERMGAQFEEIPYEQKVLRFEALRADHWKKEHLNERMFLLIEAFTDSRDVTEFNLHERTYRPIRTADEFHFIKSMLYEKAKWIPVRQPHPIGAHL